MAVYQAVRKFTLEVFKFSIYLAVPVGAYQFFAHPDRVKAFVDRFSPIERTPAELFNTIPDDLDTRLKRGEYPEDIAANMEKERQAALERKRQRLQKLQEQQALLQQQSLEKKASS